MVGTRAAREVTSVAGFIHVMRFVVVLSCTGSFKHFLAGRKLAAVVHIMTSMHVEMLLQMRFELESSDTMIAHVRADVYLEERVSSG